MLEGSVGYFRELSPDRFNPFTAKESQVLILYNFEKQVAPCESTGREVSLEWSLHRISISSTDSKVRATFQNSIIHSGSERVNYLVQQFYF